MKNRTLPFTHFILFCALTIGCSSIHAQKDTLHIYFSGMQTNISDSSEAKIGNWAKKLKGKHWDVEIIAYYESSDLKKYMAERAENLNLIVTRKARDLMTITSSGPKKGKKSQRYVADVVYSPSGASDVPAVAPATTAAPAKNSAPAQEPASTPKSASSQPAAAPTPEKAAEPAPSPNIKSSKSSSEYIYDSVYVNGKLRVTKRKVKKQ